MLLEIYTSQKEITPSYPDDTTALADLKHAGLELFVVRGKE